ncbi:YraN family protein [Cardiobacteriaceae bacterium TAE3-ERU3]|nr:YraN family protein [Cardiobacteriaceae bacterium TAE3-ERU3]
MFHKLAAHLRRGQYGEQLATRHLKQQGLQIIANNVHTRYGEIDIIAQDGDVVVFIEVRTRKEHAKVSAAESINHSKQQKWQRSALAYLQQHYPQPPSCRFDAVCITIPTRGKPNIKWLQNVIS